MSMSDIKHKNINSGSAQGGDPVFIVFYPNGGGGDESLGFYLFHFFCLNRNFQPSGIPSTGTSRKAP